MTPSDSNTLNEMKSTAHSRDHFNPLDLLRLTKTLNEVESCKPADCWGGGNMIMGSPREAGSGLSIDEFTQHMNKAMAICQV